MTALYAFAYQIDPPLGEADVSAIESLLEERSAHARSVSRSWAGRVLLEADVTRVLVVTDAADPDDAINLQLEAELLRRGANFSITAPMAVAGPGAAGAGASGA